MPRGGARPGAGRPKTAQTKREPRKPKATAANVAPDIVKAAKAAALSPLDYMLQVMNSDGAETGRRDRMAVAAAPFVHARAEEAKPGKKDQRANAAQEAGKSSRLTPPAPPKLVSNRS